MGLSKEGDWEYYDNALKLIASGNGIDSLKAALPEDSCGFGYIRLEPKNIGNTGSDIVNFANIILQWKGPNSGGMAKVKNNTGLANASSALSPNKGNIQVLGTQNLTLENIQDRWAPGSGSKIIQDD